jgi:hypothetical protein
MSTVKSTAKKRSKRAPKSSKTTKAAPVGFYNSLDALEKVVGVAVNGDQPSVPLLRQVDYYLANLQDGADLVNVMLYQHSVTKLLEIMKGIGCLHENLLSEETLTKAVKEDKNFAVKLLTALYREGGATLAFMESKSKLFDTDGLKKSAMLATTTDSAEASKTISKLPSAKREELRGIISNLIKNNENDTRLIGPPTEDGSTPPTGEVETTS